MQVEDYIFKSTVADHAVPLLELTDLTGLSGDKGLCIH